MSTRNKSAPAKSSSSASSSKSAAAKLAASAAKSKSKNWTVDETKSLLDVIEIVLPSGSDGWKQVAIALKAQYKIEKDYDQCKRRFGNLKSKPIPTGGKSDSVQQRALDLDEKTKLKHKIAASVDSELSSLASEGEEPDLETQSSELNVEISDPENNPNNNNNSASVEEEENNNNNAFIEQEQIIETEPIETEDIKSPEFKPTAFKFPTRSSQTKRKAPSPNSTASSPSSTKLLKKELLKQLQLSSTQAESLAHSTAPDYTPLAMLLQSQQQQSQAAQQSQQQQFMAFMAQQQQQFMLLMNRGAQQ